MSSQDVVLAAVGLHAGYGRVAVVHDLDLEVRAGEIAVLLGPNGAGKTTTILTLSGELEPLAGTVLSGGTVAKDALYKRSRAGLGLITERRAVLMTLNVMENLRVARSDIGRALELFPELEPHMRRPVALLSGGQQQMLAMARVLARRPSVVLADELSLGLAPIMVDRLLLAIRGAADNGVGVLLVEQHVHKAMEVADHVYVLRRGRVAMSGSAVEMRARVDEIQRSYLHVEESTMTTSKDDAGAPCA